MAATASPVSALAPRGGAVGAPAVQSPVKLLQLERDGGTQWTVGGTSDGKYSRFMYAGTFMYGCGASPVQGDWAEVCPLFAAGVQHRIPSVDVQRVNTLQ